MYRLYIKIAIRYLLKNKLYSGINIVGLSIGIASFILIMLYVNYELSYDKFQGSENVYRVYMDYLEDGSFVPGDAQAYNKSGPALKQEFPEIVEQTRLFRFNKMIFLLNDKIFEETEGYLADQSYFDVFKYKLLEGNIKSCLENPYTIVLTESFSKKLFGNKNPLLESLSVFYKGKEAKLKVTGIIQDIPKNTHIKAQYLISLDTFKSWEAFAGQQELNWIQNNYFTYLKVSPNTNVDNLQKKISNFNFENSESERHNIESLEEIHLYSDKPYEAEANGSASRVRYLSIISIMILLLSWLNYVSLSTSKSLERAKEVGIRKVAGAKKSQLIVQSLLESIILNMVAICLAFILVLVFLPNFNNYTGKDLSFDTDTLILVVPAIGFILLGTLLSGLYPALSLSRYEPAKALKGKISKSPSALAVRKGMIILQFVATIVLLVGTTTVSKQINDMESQPIGVDLNQIIALKGEILNTQMDSSLMKSFAALGGELKNFPFVDNTAITQTFPGEGYDNLSSFFGMTYPDGTKDDNKIFYNYAVSPDYFKLMKIDFVAGEEFVTSSDDNTNNIIVNEKFVKSIGLTDAANAIGKTVKFWDDDWVISGVMKNYHHFGLKNSISPLIIRSGHTPKNLLVKLNRTTKSMAGFDDAIKQIENSWMSFFPKSTFEYTVLEEKFQSQYGEDKQFGVAFRIFTILAIFIASIGLFGITSYICIQRRKEVGIRKTNGATILQILFLLNKDFVKWVGIAFIIALPVSYYAMNSWLENFAYQTSLSWWIFVLSGITCLVIAILTVSWQSFAAANVNPVDVLKQE